MVPRNLASHHHTTVLPYNFFRLRRRRRPLLFWLRIQMQMNKDSLDDRPFVDEADNLHLAAARGVWI
jgi:hypothetical protein